jgi:uncharacterized repeat protein (TIGR01451 family)
MVRADGIYMTNMKSRLTQSSINLLTAPSRAPGVQSGDIVEYVLEAQVANAAGGPGVYFTTYIPTGVEVLGAWFVTDATGATRRDPGQGGQANDGWGPRGEKTFNSPFDLLGNSRQSDLYGDTGIFYSTDSRTQLFTDDSSNIAKGPTASPLNTGSTSNGYNVRNSFYGTIDAFNLWDANQVKAFGRSTNATPPVDTAPTSTAPIINLDIQGATPFGMGSPVAGSDTGYTRDNTGNVGPWNRIQYFGSKIADVSDGKATAIGDPNTATLQNASSLGTALSDSAPLLSTTNAVRWSDGLRKLNDVVYVKVRVKINAAAIAATTGTLLNFEATGSDNWGTFSRDNPWRYFGPTVAQSAQLSAAKEVYKVNGVVYTGGVVPAGATITYRVRYLNLSSLPVKGISFKDTLPAPIATTGCTALLPTLGSLSNGVTVSSVTTGTSTCPAAAATVTFGNLPNVTSGVIPALRGGEFTYDVKLSPTATNGTVVTNSANFAGQDIVATTAVSAISAISVTVGVLPADYSDAPISGTAPNGTGTNNYGTATHTIVSSLKLGANIDSETASIANATATGDGTDDDGIPSFPILTTGATSYSIPAANIMATGTGRLHAWIDFNKNGTFDVGEYTSVAVNSNTPAGALNWTGITVGAVGNTFARFRFTSDTTVTASTPSGLAVNGEVEDYQVSIGKQTINNTPSATSCSLLGGTLSGNNLFTPLDNGTFGVENGSPNQSPAIDPYLGIVSGGTYKQFYSIVHGSYSYIANPVTPRNAFQHPGITDPVYGVTGRFFASDPNTSTPTLATTLTGLIPNQFYEYSFWAANSEPNGNPNNVDVLINSQRIYSTGDLTAFPAALEWKKHTVSFTNAASTSITIDLKSTKTGSAGNDFYLDNIELRDCNFTVDAGDAPPSYGDAIHTTIPTTPNVYLGAVAPDGETSTPLGGDNGAGADGDDANQSSNDEDAFTALKNVPTTGIYALTNIPVKNTSGGNVTLHAWIDFNRDGKFAVGEYQSTTVANNASTANLSWTVPNTATAGNTYARFRITPNAVAVDNVSTTDVDERSKDAVINGEVEDYPVSIGNPADVLLLKRITAINGLTTNPNDNKSLTDVLVDPNWKVGYVIGATDGGKVKPGDTIEYTIYYLNNGGRNAKSARICDRLNANQSFQQNTYTTGAGMQVQLGGDRITNTAVNLTNQSGDDGGHFIAATSPVTALPTNCNSITGANNDYGALILDLAGTTSAPVFPTLINLPNTTGQGIPNNSFGFWRFITKVNKVSP